MFKNVMAITSMIVILILAGCTAKEPMGDNDPWGEPTTETVYNTEADTLTYDFLAEAEPEVSPEVAAEPDLPVIQEVVSEPVAESMAPLVEATPQVEEVVSRPPVEAGPLYWVQIFASSSQQSAERAALEADGKLENRVRILFLEPYYKVLVGGFNAREEAVELRRQLTGQGYPDAWIFQK
jgi:cell division protein FtsN